MVFPKKGDTLIAKCILSAYGVFPFAGIRNLPDGLVAAAPLAETQGHAIDARAAIEAAALALTGKPPAAVTHVTGSPPLWWPTPSP